MSAELYEVIALGMRYWFAALGVLIVFSSLLWLLHDRRLRARRLHQLPDAGLVGVLIVLEGNDDLPADAEIGLPWEGTLGFVRTADVVVPSSGVAAMHLDLRFQPGLGILVTPRPGCTCLIDGVQATHRTDPAKAPLLDGSILTVGDAVLEVCFFDGMDVRSAAPVQEPEAPAAAEESVEYIEPDARDDTGLTAGYPSMERRLRYEEAPQEPPYQE